MVKIQSLVFAVTLALLMPAPARAQVDPKVMMIVVGAAVAYEAGRLADTTPALPTAAERRAADVVSWASSLTAIALDTKASYDCADRVRCFELQGVRTGVTYGAVFAAKFLVHRARPCAALSEGCGADNPDFSFFSGHTAIAFSTVGGPRLAFSLPLAIGTGGLRVAAGKHWMTDTLVGAGVGLLTSRIR